MRLPQPLENLIDQLSKLPGIGPKTAQRLALYIMRIPRAEVQALASALLEMKKHVRPCSRCGNLTVADPCAICSDPLRDKSLLCVVEEASNIIALERTGYKGLYFVLNQDFNLMNHRNLQSLDFSAALLFAFQANRGFSIYEPPPHHPDIPSPISSRREAAKFSL